MISLHLPLNKKHTNIKNTLSINTLICFTTLSGVYFLDTLRMIFRQNFYRSERNPFSTLLKAALLTFKRFLKFVTLIWKETGIFCKFSFPYPPLPPPLYFLYINGFHIRSLSFPFFLFAHRGMPTGTYDDVFTYKDIAAVSLATALVRPAVRLFSE